MRRGGNATIIAKAYLSHASVPAVLFSVPPLTQAFQRSAVIQSDSAGFATLACTAVLLMDLAEVLARVTAISDRRFTSRGESKEVGH